MSKVKLGIIGVGNMGTTHCLNWATGKLPEIELVAVADRRESRREWAKERLPETVTIFNEGDELIESGLCEAIVIAVPHYQHPVLAMKGFEHGLHVMSEKPAGVYTKQVREMNEAAAKSGLVFGMMFNQRTNPLYRKMHDMIANGELGEIKRVNWIITNWFRTQAYYDSGSWRATWGGEGGGVLLNQCPHNLDLLQWICGMPCKIQSHCHEGKWHNIEVEDDVTTYMEYPNGATGVFITTTGDYPGTNRFEITGELGKLVCEDSVLKFFKLEQGVQDYCNTSPEGFGSPKGEWITLADGEESSQHVGVMNAFAGKILHGTDLIANGEEGINGLTLSNAMHLSSWLGKEVTLPIDEDLFLEELNKRVATSKVKEEGNEVTFTTEGSYNN